MFKKILNAHSCKFIFIIFRPQQLYLEEGKISEEN